MKKIISVITVIMLIAIALTACGNKSKVSNEDVAAMSGKWNLVLYDCYGVKMFPKDMDAQMSFEFNKNKAVLSSDDGTDEYKWEKDGELITIWVNDGEVSKGRTAVVEGDSFTLYWKYNDDVVQMIFAREGTDAENSDLYVTEDDVTSKMLMNIDETGIMEIMEKMTPEARKAFELDEIYDSLKKAESE